MRLLYTGIIAALFFAVSCEKQSGFSSETTLEGTWVVKQQWSDPGNGSGKYTDVTTNPAPLVTFNADGSASCSSTFWGLQMLDSFKLVDSMHVLLSFKEHSSQPQTTYRYSFSDDTLILNPPCIEGCGLKLIRSASSSK